MKKKIWLTVMCFLLVFTMPAMAKASSYFDFFGPLPQTQAKPVTKNPRVLFIGNSFTIYNNMPDVFRNICSKNGISAHVKVVGRETQTLYSYAYPKNEISKSLSGNIKSLLKNQRWDYVVLQDQRYAGVKNIGKTRKALEWFAPRIKQSGAQMVLLMTWAPQKQHHDYTDVKPVAENPKDYQTKVANAYYGLAEEYGAAVAPVGIAFMRAQELMPQIGLYRDDRYHPNVSGSYLEACTIFGTLFGKSAEGTSYYPQVSGMNSSERVQTGKKLQAIAGDVTVRGAARDNARPVISAKEVILKNGSRQRLTCQISGGVKGSRIVSWRSGNSKVAVVDQNGTVTAKGCGTTKVSVKLNNNATAVVNIIVTEGDMRMGVGQKHTMQSAGAMTWRSSNSDIVAVKGSQIQAKQSGTATLTGTAKTGITIKLKITVKGAPKSVKIVSKPKTIFVGRQATLKTSFGYTTSVGGVKFTSSNPRVISVDDSGVLTAKRPGKVKITAKSYNGKKTSCTIRAVIGAQTIKFHNVSGLLEMKRGKTQTLKVSFYPRNTSIKTLKWKSSNHKVVSVTQKGKIKAVRKGTAVISAATTDGSGLKISVKVQVR